MKTTCQECGARLDASPDCPECGADAPGNETIRGSHIEPLSTDRERLRRAFERLRTAGYVAWMNRSCCGGCLAGEMGVAYRERYERENGRAPKEGAEKAVGWHRQSNDSFREDGDLEESLFLIWGGDPREIAAALRAEGLRVVTPADESECVEVLPSQPTDAYLRRLEARIYEQAMADQRDLAAVVP